ncbi:MAG TPA: phosphotransferase [Solirubrobacterales bacterium]
MTARRETVLLVDRLSDHPAVRVWRGIDGGATPSSVEVLKEKSKSAVFRLKGAGPGGASVIAKRRERDGLDFERRLYTEVLPALSVPSLEILGFVEADDGRSWIFLEDAGELWYTPAAQDHLALAVRWLADLHTGSSDWVASMPDTGPRYFRTVADVAIEGLTASLDHPALSDGDRSVLSAAASHIEAVRDGWDEIEEACSLAPTGLVHGDFVPKNIRVRNGRDGPELVVFDWETAGAASPAADIALLPEDGPSLRGYHALVRNAWPGLSWEDVECLARVGRVLRLVHAVRWELRSFRHPWVERALRKMRAYERALQEAVEPGMRLQR